MFHLILGLDNAKNTSGTLLSSVNSLTTDREKRDNKWAVTNDAQHQVDYYKYKTDMIYGI